MGCEQGGKDRAKKEEDGEDVKPDLESQQVRFALSSLFLFFPFSPPTSPIDTPAPI